MNSSFILVSEGTPPHPQPTPGALLLRFLYFLFNSDSSYRNASYKQEKKKNFFKAKKFEQMQWEQETRQCWDRGRKERITNLIVIKALGLLWQNCTSRILKQGLS